MNQEQCSQDRGSCPHDEARPAPRKTVESPQAFYKRITQRQDVRRLLEQLARR
jgi:hypothetical protein